MVDPAEDPWSAKDVQDLAIRSGRPLEVETALSFLKAGWKVQLGHYYFDLEQEKAREIDVIAHKSKRAMLDGKPILCVVDIFISCKGFKDNECPLLYSLSDQSIRDYLKPQLMYTKNGEGYFDTKLGKSFAELAIAKTGLDPNRRTVAFDILKRDELTEKEKSKRGLDAQIKAYDHERVTNKDLFEGIDSAFKAAIYWNKIQRDSYYYAVLRIPLLVTSKQWLEVSLDSGKPGEPILGTKGFKSTAYPHQGGGAPPENITTLICAQSELPTFIAGLNELSGSFMDEQNLLWNG